MKTLKKPSLCEIPSRDNIFRTRQLERDLRRFLAQSPVQSRVRCKASPGCSRCSVRCWEPPGMEPVQLCALAFPSIQLECLLVQVSPLFLSLPPWSTDKPGSVSWIPSPRLGQAALGAPGCVHHPGWTSPAPSGVCSDHPGGLCLSVLSVLMSGWNWGTQRWRQCCAADCGVSRGV